MVPENTPHWFGAIQGRIVVMSLHVPDSRVQWSPPLFRVSLEIVHLKHYIAVYPVSHLMRVRSADELLNAYPMFSECSDV